MSLIARQASTRIAAADFFDRRLKNGTGGEDVGKVSETTGDSQLPHFKDDFEDDLRQSKTN